MGLCRGLLRPGADALVDACTPTPTRTTGSWCCTAGCPTRRPAARQLSGSFSGSLLRIDGVAAPPQVDVTSGDFRADRGSAVSVGSASRIAVARQDPRTKTKVRAGHRGAHETRTARPWNVVVWDDPINLMSYVVWVFQRLFGWPCRKRHEAYARGAHAGPLAGGQRGARAGRVSRVADCTATACRRRSNAPANPADMARVERAGDAGSPRRWILHLPPLEAKLVASLPDQLSELLNSPGGNPARDRPAVPAGLRRRPRGGRAPPAPRRRAARAAPVNCSPPCARCSPRRRATGRGVRLEFDEAGLDLWLRFVNDIRLVLATDLGIEKNLSEVKVPPRPPRRGAPLAAGLPHRLEGGAGGLARRSLTRRSAARVSYPAPR